MFIICTRCTRWYVMQEQSFDKLHEALPYCSYLGHGKQFCALFSGLVKVTLWTFRALSRLQSSLRLAFWSACATLYCDWELLKRIFLVQLQRFPKNSRGTTSQLLHAVWLWFLCLICLLKGSGIHSSEVVSGMVFKREVEGDIKALRDAKIVAFSCPLDSMNTETKVSGIKTAGQFSSS